MKMSFARTNQTRVMELLLMFSVVLCAGSVDILSAEPGAQSKQDPVHIHLIGAASEYNAKDTMMILKKRLMEGYNVHVTMTRGPGEAKDLDGLEALKDADLLVLYARRLELNENDWKSVNGYLQSSRPIVGIRTASHAFDKNFPDFDKQILGADYEGHKGDKPVQVDVVEEHKDHSILNGITSWKREWGDMYDNVKFDQSTTVLLNGNDGRRTMPVAWTNEVDGRRVFYTSMGMPEDFRKDKQFMRLILNGMNWSLQGKLYSRKSEK